MRLAKRGELAGASMDDIAREAGVARMTLYRRGETREVILAALRDELMREERESLFPILVSDDDAYTRLTRVIEALCASTDANADLLAGFDDAFLNSIYHSDDEQGLTRPEFVAPLVRLLRDGAAEGSLRKFDDPAEAATVLYTQVSYTYLHLRREHGWSQERATAAVTDMAVLGLRA
jgi:AcrR family transcriptional regulator